MSRKTLRSKGRNDTQTWKSTLKIHSPRFIGCDLVPLRNAGTKTNLYEGPRGRCTQSKVKAATHERELVTGVKASGTYQGSTDRFKDQEIALPTHNGVLEAIGVNDVAALLA